MMMTARQPVSGGWRARLRAWVESDRFQRAITLLIVINAVTLGLETVDSVVAAWGDAIAAADLAILAIFVVELATRVAAHGPRFFLNGWNLFDAAVVGVALLPSSDGLSILRALRVLRAFRLISVVPAMRSIIEALLKSIPGLSSIILLMLLLFYVFAVMATRLYGETTPDHFGSIGASMYALFQIMTLEGWTEIVDAVRAHHDWALMFFIPFMMLSTFTVLNLFIALIVDSMQKLHKVEVVDAEVRTAEISAETAMARELKALAAEIRDLRATVERLRRAS